MMLGTKNIIYTVVILSITVMLFGCLKAEEYPVEPSITFKSFQEISSDSAVVTFSFIDGDGDIGLGESETEAPYNPGSKFYNNVFIRYFEKVNGSWVQGMDASGLIPVEFNYRTEKLTPSGKNKALKGTIIIYLTPSFYNDGSPNADTIQYDIQIADRALHLSNLVETGEIYPN